MTAPLLSAPALAPMPDATKEYRHVVGLVRSNPWAIRAEKLAEIDAALASRIAHGPPTDAELRERLGDLPPSKTYQVQNGVALIPVFGTIAKRADRFTRASGGTSTEQLAADLAAALADPAVSRIVLDVDSPGGSAHGPAQLSAAIRAARGTKPIVAIANDEMASAAYWIGSAADRVFATPTAAVGSIGVVAIHQDRSAALGEAGIRTTVLSAGKYKAVGNPYQPLDTDSRAVLQARLDYFYALFLEAVATNRGVAVDHVAERMADGRVFIGRQALEAGLIDGIATLDQLLAGDLPPVSRITFFAKGSIMSDANPTNPTTTPPPAAPPADQVPPSAPPTNPTNPPAPPPPAAPINQPTPALGVVSAQLIARETRTDAANVAKEAAAEAIAAERARAKTIRELCAAAGSGSAGAWIDAGMSVEDVRMKLLDELCKARPTIGAGTDGLGDSGAGADPDVKFKAEFTKQRSFYDRMGISEEEYIRTRRIDEGIDKLIPTKRAS